MDTFGQLSSLLRNDLRQGKNLLDKRNMSKQTTPTASMVGFVHFQLTLRAQEVEFGGGVLSRDPLISKIGRMINRKPYPSGYMARIGIFQLSLTCGPANCREGM
jgi:hypothetical protein